jgi:hypothetical protein
MRNMKNRRIDRALRIDRPENRNNDERARSSFVTFPLTETETPAVVFVISRVHACQLRPLHRLRISVTFTSPARLLDTARADI